MSYAKKVVVNEECFYCQKKFEWYHVTSLESLKCVYDKESRKVFICADCLREKQKEIETQVNERHKKERERGVIHAYRD